MIIDLQLFSITSGSYVTDYRRDPVTGNFVSEEITAEPQTVIIIPGSGGRRGFWLIEIPDPNHAIVLTRTETVDNAGVYTPDGSPPTYTLVTGAPATEEFFQRLEQGLVILNNDEFNNVAQLGNKFEVAYYGIGTNMNVKNTQFIEQAALDSKLSRDGSLPMTGDLDFDSNKGVNLANGSSPGDAVNKGQLDSGIAGAFTSPQTFTTLKLKVTTNPATPAVIYSLIGIGGTTVNITGVTDTLNNAIWIYATSGGLNFTIQINGNNIITTTAFNQWVFYDGTQWRS
jgi:hypothetical protein